MVMEETLESPLDSKEIKPVNQRKSTLNIHWKDDAEAEAPILCPPDVKSHITGKNPDAGRKPEGKRRRGQQRVRWLNGITDS